MVTYPPGQSPVNLIQAISEENEGSLGYHPSLRGDLWLSLHILMDELHLRDGDPLLLGCGFAQCSAMM